MSNADIRTALALGWLIERLARLERRTVPQVAAELVAYLDRIDTETQRRG